MDERAQELRKVLLRLAGIYNKPDEFINSLQQQVVIQPGSEGIFFFRVGEVLFELSYFTLALHTWEYASQYFVKVGDRANLSPCYASIGNAYVRLSDFGKAIEYHEKALEIAEEMGDRIAVSKCYGNIGSAYFNFGDFGKAIEYHKNSLEIAEEVGDKMTESKCYGNLGNVYANSGNYRKAIEYYEKALELAIEIRDRGVESSCYGALGLARYRLGDFRKAIEYNEKSLRIAVELGSRTQELTCYGNLVTVYRSLGDFKKAIEYHERSLKTAIGIGDRSAEAKCYTNVASVYRYLGNVTKAIEYHKLALKIAEEIGARSLKLSIWGDLANVYAGLRDSGKAIEYYEKALETAIEIRGRDAEAHGYANLGNVHADLGNHKKAIDYYEKALEIVKETGDIDLERVINFNLGLFHKKSGNYQHAYDYFKYSIELSEVISGRLVEEEHRIGAYAQASNAYKNIVPICLELGKQKEAFEYVGRSKSRAFLDLLAAVDLRPTIESTAELRSLLDKEEIHLIKLREIQTRHLRQTARPVEPGEVDNLWKSLNQIYGKLEQLDAEYVSMRKGRPFPLERIQETLSSKKRPVVLVEYFITKHETFVFLISSRDRELYVKSISISEEELLRYLQSYRRAVVNPPSFQDVSDTWLELSHYLIEPISELLVEGDLIYFVPYGLLHYLPLHALKLNGNPLIENHPVAYSPSASLVRFCQKRGSRTLNSCASFGVVFEQEAKDVAALFDTQAFRGHSATKSRVLSNCTDKDIIHFSCHGYFDNEDPLSSGIELHGGKVLTAREVFDIRLRATLVTLSACQTGLNERRPGDDLIGLTRSFLYAGSSSVIVSLWSVDAHSTRDLMLEFYTHLKRGMDKATALQQAQKRVREQQAYSHPYYWAPFVLVGCWE